MISVFTPTHDASFLPDVYQSLVEQTCPEFEWCILYNNGAQPIGFDDPRVKERIAEFVPPWVGALKAAACAQATGDILLELDHDDLLLPTAIEDVARAFERPEVGFVYSNALHASGELGGDVQRFGAAFGWRHRETRYNGATLYEPITFAPNPDSVSRIWYAPNHLRAFRRSVYDAVGGYNREMRVLDDQDLMARLYCATEFTHIDKGLYVYRIHGNNSWLAHNGEIQQNVERLYEQHIEAMALAWAKRRGLRTLDIGGGLNPAPGYETVDQRATADVVTDLSGRWPFEDSSVGVVRAYDVIEHLADSIHTMTEMARVLAPGGWAFIHVPSTDGRGAFQDPTHCSFWNENSFLYYTHARWARYIDTPVRFQAARLYTTEPDARRVSWVVAHLVNMKDGYRPAGLVEI